MKKLSLIILFFVMFTAGYLIDKNYRPILNPTVSVILPTYNRAALLPAAIESILNQTYKNFELIIIENGSSDNTMELLNTYQKKDKRIKIINNPMNRGISYARNQGNKIARGKYIAIMDSDDISLPKRLEKQVAFMEENPDIIAASSWKKELDTGIVWTRSTDEQEILFMMHFNNMMGHPETIMRRDFLLKHNIWYNEKLISSVDYDLFKQIIFAGGKLARQPVTILLYRMHTENGRQYYRVQALTRRLISKAFLKKYDIDWSGDANPTCELVGEMIKNNAKVRWISDEFLRKKQRQLCPFNSDGNFPITQQ